MKQFNWGINGTRAGVSLVMVTFAVSVLATLSVSMVMVSSSASKEKRADREQVAALFAAEAGISEAVFALNNGQSANIGTAQSPVSRSGSTFYVQETSLGAGLASLVATGADNSSAVRLELTVRQTNTSIWTWGAFGDENLSMDSNAHVDSFDSRLGTYQSQLGGNSSGNSNYAQAKGHVGSNGNISLKSNSSVHGDATCGPTGTTVVTGNAEVSGSTVPNTGVVEIPALTIPSFGSTGNYSLGGNGSATLPSGDYEFDDFQLKSNAQLTVIGPARLVMENFELRSNAELWVDASAGPVEIFVLEDFVMASNTLLASMTFTPSDVTVNLNSNNIVNPTQNVQLAEVAFESNSKLYGMLLAPNAEVDIDSNFELFGSVIGKRVHLDSNSNVHFDEALLDISASGGQPTWEAVCWRRLSSKTPIQGNYP